MQGWAREEIHSNTIAAGIDVAKAELVVALSAAAGVRRYGNDGPGRWRLLRELERLRGMGLSVRVGLEASGGYERQFVALARRHGFDTLVFQPGRVKAYARYLNRHAKTDTIDAGLIALAAAAYDGGIRSGDERLLPLAERLTFIEQIEDDIARLKTRRDGFTLAHLGASLEAEIKRLGRRRTAALAALRKALRQEPDLAARLDLVTSVEGIGERTGLCLIIRMPELGSLSREEAASLAGLAPFDNQTGQRDSERHIKGGRSRVRRSLYAAALPAAFRWNPALTALYKRLIAKGKKHQQALIACAHKLIIYANAVLQRQTPWAKTMPQS